MRKNNIPIVITCYHQIDIQKRFPIDMNGLLFYLFGYIDLPTMQSPFDIKTSPQKNGRHGASQLEGFYLRQQGQCVL